MEPPHIIIIIALVLIIVLLTIFNCVPCLSLILFRRTAGAQAIQALQGKKRK